jgi:ABC-type bacteriocin/lantibiotic exporter with double-glycine peptidase domain
MSWKQSKFTSEMSVEISHKLFLGYMKQPYVFHLQKNSAELIRNIQNEVAQFSFISQSFIALAIEVSIILGVSIMLIMVEPIGALVIVLFLSIAIYVFYRLTKNRLLDWGIQRQGHATKSNQHLIQGLSGVKDIKILGREEYFVSQFDHHNLTNAKIQIKSSTLGLVPRSYLEFLAVIGLAGLILIMLNQNKDFTILIPTLGVFAASAFRMIPSANRIMTSLQGIRFSKPVIDLLYSEFKNIQDVKISNNDQLSKVSFVEDIKLSNIYFKYPGSNTYSLNNVSLNIKKGESIGFIGQSGSGKSTLVDLILGLLEESDGQFLIDNASKFDIKQWQKKIGYVPQTIYLTDDKLINNIAFGIPQNEINFTRVKECIDASQLTQLVEELENGINTYVGERGVRLSGGQKQRIGIARALYSNPEILIFDEATSALDSNTEIEVMKSIDVLKGHKTLILVAHRISTLKNCDKIFTLDKGKIIKTEIQKKIS